MRCGLLSPFRMAARAKTASITIIAILISVGTAYADDTGYSAGCEKKDTWCNLKAFAKDAKDFVDLISAGKTVLQLLNIIEDPNKQFLEELKKGFADLRWAGAQHVIGDAQTDINTAISDLKNNGNVATAQDDWVANHAVQALMAAGHKFEVFYLPPESDRQDYYSWLHYIKDDLDPQGPNDSTYDWRLGLPALMQLIKYRLFVLAAFHPNFRVDGYGFSQLKEYRDELVWHYDKMLKGLRCVTRAQQQ